MVTLGQGCRRGAATVSGRQVLRGEISINSQQEHFDPQSDKHEDCAPCLLPWFLKVNDSGVLL